MSERPNIPNDPKGPDIPLQDLSRETTQQTGRSPATSPSRRSVVSRSLFRSRSSVSPTGQAGRVQRRSSSSQRSAGGLAPRSSTGDEGPTVAEARPVFRRSVVHPNIPVITTSLAEDDGRTTTQSTVFDNEGGMNVDMDTMRRGLVEVLAGETQGGWMGHSRRRSNAGQSISHPPGTSPGTSPVDTHFPQHQRASVGLGLGSPTFGGPDDYFGDYYLNPAPGTISEEEEDDQAGLTDPVNLQPMGMSPQAGKSPTSEAGTPRGRKRSLSHNVRFDPKSSPSRSPGTRLGDDLHQAEQGMRRASPRRGGSPGRKASIKGRKMSLAVPGASSPVRRVSMAVQNISQRVVNLSNDPNADIGRRPSVKSSRSDISPAASPGERPGVPPMSPTGSSEKVSMPSSDEPPPPPEFPRKLSINPLKGNSLKLFPPDNKLRIFLCDVLTHPITEPFILLTIIVQVVLLTVDSAKNIFVHPDDNKWGSSASDYALLGIFILYTMELVARIIVSGFIINPDAVSNNIYKTWKAYIEAKLRFIFTPSEQQVKMPTVQQLSAAALFPSMAHIHSGQGFLHTRDQQRFQLSRRAFLRHSFNRLDFLAVVSYWIAFVLAITGLEETYHLYLFRMLSCLRILRLLGITSGTGVILRSLKKAAPLLVNVAFLISFFWLLFAIIGVQSFKSSLRRTCVWIDPLGVQENYTQEFQFCGGYIDASSLLEMPYMFPDGSHAEVSPKGYICPINSLCVEGGNPYGGTVSFDNILQSMELVFIIISSNTFTDIMYYTADSDYLWSALFFIFGMIILTFWLVNLLVAVITSSFQVIREESKQSAFRNKEDEDDESSEETPHVLPATRINKAKKLYEKTEFVWILIIFTGLAVACTRSADMSQNRRDIINGVELSVSLLLLAEIILRFAVDWRGFFKVSRNYFDLALAIITCVMEIPVIKDQDIVYSWLTLFQILRFYRIVLFVPVTRNLLLLVLGSVGGILNLLFFVLLITFLCSIFAVQLLRGNIPQDDGDGNEIRITFQNIWNSFLGMYQIFSSEGWTTILYDAQQYENRFHVGWISAIFFILWFILANLIILNMFIAVIQENFDVTEDEKRLWQIKSFLQKKDGGNPAGNLSLSSLFRFGKAQQRDPIEFGHAGVEMLTRNAIVDEFLDDRPLEETPNSEANPAGIHHQRTIRFDDGDMHSPDVLTKIGQWVNKIWKAREENPFHTTRMFNKQSEIAPTAMAQELAKSRDRIRRAQREYLIRHPGYNVSLFIFGPKNPIRRMCQRIVGPSHGSDRFDGVSPFIPVWLGFSALVYTSIIAMVILACITTPLYQKDYFETHGYTTRSWFVFADIGFASLFTLEALIKIIADGLYWTPNAYLRNVWGIIDAIVLITLWISVGTSFADQGEIARAVGAFKALRALRLLNVSDSARETFNSMLFGARKLISAAFVSLALLIPFAIYGVNLFAGKMVSCNDGSVEQLDDCIFEYASSPYNWDVLAPRVAQNPWYSFDNFGDSLLILFQIVSQEGWTDVLWQAMSITGLNMQPVQGISQYNAIFFLAFNLLGAVFVLTLFVSVFMRNYTEQTGVAFLTAEQRSWLELRKLLRQIGPSKRPSNSPGERWKAWCYNRSVRKHGRWNGFITTVLLLHLLLLVIEYYPASRKLDTYRDIIFLCFALVYAVNIAVRIIGLTWEQYIKSRWDVFGLFVVTGTLGTTTAIIAIEKAPIFVQFQKLFLVLDTLLLIPRNNQLDQLFKTAAASFQAIGNLLLTWLVLFVVYAIALVQSFGLTRLGENGDGNRNFRTIPNALVVLFRMSCGEGWNQIMYDYSVTTPNCVMSSNFFSSDCGSKGYARFLFISWNIISMYIFVSMFVSLIFESFSYVYQQSGAHNKLSREDIRRFKRAWSRIDPRGTGFIPPEKLPRLLAELDGVFQMRIYDGHYTVKSILKDCRVGPENDRLGIGVDLKAFNQRLASLPVWKIRRQRHVYTRFVEECYVAADKERGISFTTVLLILAHYKLIVDNKSLRLEEFLRRRAKLQMVEDHMQRNIVRNFFRMIVAMREFSSISGRKSTVPYIPVIRTDRDRTSTVPQIYVESESTPDLLATLTVDMGRPRPSTAGSPRYGAHRVSFDDTLHVVPLSPTGSGVSPLTTPAEPRNSFGSWNREPHLGEPSQHLRADARLSTHDVLDAFQSSSWGAAMRRSVSHAGRRRSGDHQQQQQQQQQPNPRFSFNSDRSDR
ncbi:calcium channel protein [Orbilia oligospora]|uniref:Calcium-channel protein CCH1 n=1 Tax=Orbilia oligospora TaxID=2813651 RepID=A0A7C8UNE8_ORBOL|nr:calcium channel protein [Orbilia oligospora]KAF3216057.1 calcium channel protein [Orbilia oligospora]